MNLFYLQYLYGIQEDPGVPYFSAQNKGWKLVGHSFETIIGLPIGNIQ